MHRQTAAQLFHHSRRKQPRQRLAEALRHAVAIREAQPANSQGYEFWAAVAEDLKSVHLKMPKCGGN